MTNDEVIDLLTLMASYDRRTVGKADVAAWRLVVGDLPFADAEQAVLGHYTDSRDFAMPVDIRKRVKAIRSERIAHAVIQAPAPELADDPWAYRKALTGNIRDAADGRALPAPAAPLAIASGGAQDERGGPPVTLHSALTEFRRTLGPARRRNHIGDPQAVAAEQVREAAEERAKRNRDGEVA